MNIFCTECGKENRAEAQFCKKCGAELENDGEQETRVATRRNRSEPDSEEVAIFSIRPTLMFVKMGYGLAVVAAFLLAAVLEQPRLRRHLVCDDFVVGLRTALVGLFC